MVGRKRAPRYPSRGATSCFRPAASGTTPQARGRADPGGIALNDATFREANEQIEAAAHAYGVEVRVPFICECADRSCIAIVRMSLENYDEVRANPRRFFNAPGHQAAGGGAAAVVAEREGYVIVEKQDRDEEVAETSCCRLDG
jgi:hypothetical protein